ncbi:MAG: Aminodeoxychorismate/anthranilate synthase component 2 [Candidatus Anoxychlamydiales bacterium]|nr:Aminodeoxychorismate/anthranilate synthase component 2 [Candidatus Anoxychlamydiales bacterium]
MKKIFILLLCLSFYSCNNKKVHISKPSLKNNPSWDIICTNKRPLISFFNSKGGIGKKRYIVQIDTKDTFDSKNFIEYKNVYEENKYLASVRLDRDLIDNSRYYFRVKAIDEKNNESAWSFSRFYLDTSSNKHFMNLRRLNVKSIEVSSGENPKNIIDYDDPGQSSFWSATPPGPIKDFVKFDLGTSQIVKRIWMLSNPNSDNGWLYDFVWEKSLDGKNFEEIQDAKISNNDTFRNIIDIKPIKTRFLRLKINKFIGVSPQINCIIFYTPSKPLTFTAPSEKYVLLIGDQMNGGTYTQLANYIKTLNLNIKIITIPHYAASYEMIKSLKNKPFAIILSGNSANYPNLPMFEYNGVFEIIRNSNIPILGICAGHQMLVFSEGYSFVRSMGWADLTSLEKLDEVKPIKIVKQDPIFKNIKNPFIAPEIHSWSVKIIPDDFELLAKSTYVQCIKHKHKMIYGEQFHAEVEVFYNEGKDYLLNFLKIALENN